MIFKKLVHNRTNSRTETIVTKNDIIEAKLSRSTLRMTNTVKISLLLISQPLYLFVFYFYLYVVLCCSLYVVWKFILFVGLTIRVCVCLLLFVLRVTVVRSWLSK